MTEQSNNIPVIVRHLFTLGQDKGSTKELNWVSFYGRTPRLSLHAWRIVQGQKVAGKGLMLSDSEIKVLLNGIAEKGEECLYDVNAPDAGSGGIESGSNMEDTAAENPDLEPVGVFWDPEEEAYRIVYSRE